MKYRIVKVTMHDGSSHYIVQRKKMLFFWGYINSPFTSKLSWLVSEFEGYRKFENFQEAQKALQKYIDYKKETTVLSKEVSFKSV